MRLILFICLKCRLVVGRLKCPQKNSQTCLGLFLVHGVRSASTFPKFRQLLLWQFKHWAHGSKPSVHTTWMKPLREEAGLKRRRRTGQGLGQRGKTPKKSSSQKTRDTGLLGSGRAWTSSEVEILERSTTMGWPGWVEGDWSWGDPGASYIIRLPTGSLIKLRFFTGFENLFLLNEQDYAGYLK